MTTPFDLLVIGGGINGVGVARDAAGRGLSVFLAEKGDLSEGTSSRSGKYIHGGLRYLEYFEFRLVREALIEREVILKIAPQLTKPLKLVLPHSPGQRPRWFIRLGLFLYDHLGGRKTIPPTTALRLDRVPEGGSLRDGFKHGFAYYDVWVDDSRLVVLNAVDAARLGAEIRTRTEVISARREREHWCVQVRDRRTGASQEVRAKAIFNGAGPWVETVLGNVAGVNSSKQIRLVKGSHIILKKWWEGDHGFVLQAKDKRLIFVNPYFDDLALVGTTDIAFNDRPENVAIDADEIDYLLRVLNTYFDTDLTAEHVIRSYSGVRPLFDDDARKGASAVTRDYEFELSAGAGGPPILSAFGGKLTTYRKLAEHALARLRPYFQEMGSDWTADAPLPGGDAPGGLFDQWHEAFIKEFSWLPDDLAGHYVRSYGTNARRLLGNASSLKDLGTHFGGLFYEREARWLIEAEWAETAEDILLRRTKHGIFLSETEWQAVDRWIRTRVAA
ncbi:MAG: glycerol-3-phosphate dehydrogenase [Roseibium sp.]|nr:glycerol-3-phosphate dehydrogenase [Roseibium sp.]